MIVEFNDWDAPVFEKIMRTLEYNTSFEKHRLSNEPVISLPGLEIYPDRKKIYRDRREICLTAKEADVFLHMIKYFNRFGVRKGSVARTIPLAAMCVICVKSYTKPSRTHRLRYGVCVKSDTVLK